MSNAKAVPLDLVLLLDASGSMERYDPDGGKDVLASIIIDDLRSLESEQGSTSRLAVAWFGATVGDTISLRPVHEVQFPIQPQSQIPFTDFVPAFAFAASEFQHAPVEGNRRRALVVLTDAFPQRLGQAPALTSQSGYFSPQGMLQEKIRELESLGVEILLIGIGRQAPKYSLLWQRVLSRGVIMLADSTPSHSLISEVTEFIVNPQQRLPISTLPVPETSPSLNPEIVPLSVGLSLCLVIALLTTWVSVILAISTQDDMVVKYYESGRKSIRAGDTARGHKELKKAVAVHDQDRDYHSSQSIETYRKLFSAMLMEEGGNSTNDLQNRIKLLEEYGDGNSLAWDKAQGMAEALLEFWCAYPNHLFSQFYLIHSWGNGPLVTRALGDVRRADLGHSGHAAEIVNLAKTFSDLTVLTRGLT